MEEIFGTDRSNEAIFGSRLLGALPSVPCSGIGTSKQGARIQRGRQDRAPAGRGGRCQRPGCTTIASFGPPQAAHQPSGVPPQRRAVHCASHKEVGEVSVKYLKCKTAGCDRRAICGDPGNEHACWPPVSCDALAQGAPFRRVLLVMSVICKCPWRARVTN